MTATTTHTPNFDDQAFRSALAKLNQWGDKNEGHQSEKRTSSRYDYENDKSILVINVAESHDGAAPVSFPVLARNLSRSGLSFIVTRDILPRVIKDGAVPLVINTLLHTERLLHIGLHQVPTGYVWLKSKVIRFRAIHEGLYECGIQFLAKAEGFSL